MKAGPKVLVAIALGIIILLVLTMVFVDVLIRRGIESAGSHSLGTEVELSRVNLSLLRGRLALSDLQISNPEGFKADRLFRVASAKAAVRPSALFQDELTIETIVLESPSLAIEQSARGTNVSVLLANIEGEEKKGGEEARQKLYRIKMLRITGAKVTFSSFVTMKAPVTVPLPDIQIENLSNDDGTGLILAQVIRRVLVGMLQTAMTQGKGIIPAEAISDLRGDLGRFVPEPAGEALDRTKGALEKAGEGLKGLFKK